MISRSLPDAQERARRAQALLDDPMFQEAYHSVGTAQLDVFREADSPTELTVQRAHGILRGLKAVEEYLTSVVNEEKMLAASERHKGR